MHAALTCGYISSCMTEVYRHRSATHFQREHCAMYTPPKLLSCNAPSAAIQVDKILSESELKGTVLNHKVLGERKNCNLPGVRQLHVYHPASGALKLHGLPVLN